MWSNGIQNGIPFTPNGSGSYVVCGSVGNCNDCDTLNVTVNPAPSASFLSEVSGNEAQFLYMGTPVTSFAWDFGDGGSSVLMDPNHTYPGPGIYGVLLTVTNQGCTSTYFAEIELIAPGSEAHLINVITPNGDGINDVFDLGLEGYKEVTISIVNRWGNTMVELTGNSLTWDGTVDGKPALEGVYFYQFKALGFDGNASQGHGFFHLKQ
ncbi:MAG: PKD domain-containing protein [Flavobacteriia bacterium]|nr:PKD domain-containing protein [Flavobacteriia bacterium]